MAALIKLKNEDASADVNARGSSGGLTFTMPYYVAWTARGYGFQAMATSAVAALVVRPTGTAMATLRNQNSDKVLVIERVFGHMLVTGAAEGYAHIWLCVHPAGSATVTNDITVRNSTNGKAAGGSNTYFDNGATVSDDGWFPWPDVIGQAEAAGVLPGAAVLANVNGRIMIPPTGAISMHVVSATVNEDFTSGFHWYEVPESELALS
ncbi:MAG: hypothetical protein Q8R28_18055 [Dehalococcoidia bacterium]|nr:hypothetical protein [Dehalococcoidia bacterium]